MTNNAYHDVKIVALYFPQLHPIPENDRWWGTGFTDWVNVRRAKSLYPGHQQPRVPLDRDYYDQSDPKVVRRQVAMAKEYGIGAFCHYHYWFNGKQLLETPTNILLDDKSLDIELCLSWANETWSRRWDGQDHHILIEQTHPPRKEAWERHFQYLIKAWTDKRALRVGDRPLFLIYRPEKIQHIGDMLDYWRTRARQHGIDDMFFMGVVQYKLQPWETLRHLDGVFLFQPFVATFDSDPIPRPWWRRSLDPLYNRIPRQLKMKMQTAIDKLKGPIKVDYDEVWQRIIDFKTERALQMFEGAFVDWDNTARYGDRAKVYTGANPKRFEYWMSRLVEKVAHKPRDQRLIFINAWNEWAEGAYLEPDEHAQYGYLEAIRRVVAGGPRVVATDRAVGE